jgi:hypothetical protein
MRDKKINQTNMNYPIALEVYAQIEESEELTPDLLLVREVVHNEIEVQQFFNTYSNNKTKIVTRPLTPDELNNIS